MVKFGIIGAGNIAHRFAKSLASHPDGELVAISARNEEKGRAFAKEFSVQAVYPDGAALLEDADVDAVYIALPHGLHAEWSVRAIRAGKAVLCEKPAALSEAEMKRITDAAAEEGVLFMEALKARFVPLYEALKAEVASGRIGKILSVEAQLCRDFHFGDDCRTYHMDPAMGGCVWDMGIYEISYMEDFLHGDPKMTAFFAKKQGEVEVYADAAFTFPDGTTGRLVCAFDRAAPGKITFTGDRGRIIVEEPTHPQKMTIETKDDSEVIEIPHPIDDFYGEIDAFIKCVRENRTEEEKMPLSASIRFARMTDIIKAGLHYTDRSLELLDEQEKQLSFDRFISCDALSLGNIAAELAKRESRGVSIRIVRESDGMTMFSYAMDDKTPKNEFYIEGKRQVSLMAGHSSLYVHVAHALYGEYEGLYEDAQKYVPTGGAVPIMVNGKRTATLVISGLHEGRDHALAVEAVAVLLKMKVPEFLWWAV